MIHWHILHCSGLPAKESLFTMEAFGLGLHLRLHTLRGVRMQALFSCAFLPKREGEAAHAGGPTAAFLRRRPSIRSELCILCEMQCTGPACQAGTQQKCHASTFACSD